MKTASYEPSAVSLTRLLCTSYLLIAFSLLPFGYPLVNHGRSLRNPLYVGDFAEGLMRIVSLNSDLVTGKTFDLFGYLSESKIISYLLISQAKAVFNGRDCRNLLLLCMSSLQPH